MTDTALVLSEYRGAPQQRTGRKSDWTEAMADAFVEVLADTCNVTLAAKAIDRSIGNVYKWRTKNAAFRAAWDGALATGYARLEMMMLERALHGVEKTIVARDGTTVVMRDYSDRVALTLLRMHRESAALANGISEDDDDYREACERIMERLERLKERADGADLAPGKEQGAEPGPAIEIKGARDIAALIAWGLSRRRGRGRNDA